MWSLLVVGDQPDFIFDAMGKNSDEINAFLRSVTSAGELPRVRISGLSQQDAIAVRIPEMQLQVDGTAGNYCFCSLHHGDVHLSGNADAGAGHSLESGVVTIGKNAGFALGAMASGGLIVVKGNTGARCGAGLRGADIVVGGSVGAYAGMFMNSGTIMILGNMGPQVGWGCTGGTIYVQGTVESLAGHVTEQRLKESDKLRIGLLLLNSGLQANVKDFRKIAIDSELVH
jgi:glutamate synthase domain-containing protein 3